jgi:adenylate cyclase
MIGRHLQAIFAVTLAAIWGFGIFYEHDRGSLRFLDRFESTTIDLRTLVRGASPAVE